MEIVDLGKTGNMEKTGAKLGVSKSISNYLEKLSKIP